MGKSRLCAELFAYIEERPGLIRWRQGRCLPYGEGIAFWALGEIVKAECGILESDSPDEAEAKLEQALPADDPDRAWLKARLAPLVGAGGEPASQEESFTAWRRFLESWARGAGDGARLRGPALGGRRLLSFLEHLADWAQGVPLLVLCTARPELYEQHPDLGAGRCATRPADQPRPAHGRGDRAPDRRRSSSGRCCPPRRSGRCSSGRAATPCTRRSSCACSPTASCSRGRSRTSLPGLGAGADRRPPGHALPGAEEPAPGRRRVGKVFWAGALAEMGGREPREVELALHELSRKELVRPARTSSMEGEQEYGFWHLLVQGRLLRADPARRARRPPPRGGRLDRAQGGRAGRGPGRRARPPLPDRARARRRRRRTRRRRRSSRRQRDPLPRPRRRARALRSTSKAQRRSSPGRSSSPPPATRERAFLLERWAQAAQQQGRLQEAQEALEEALALYRERGETVAAGRVLTALSTSCSGAWATRAAEEAIAEALALLEAEPPGPELVAAYARAGGHALRRRRLPGGDRGRRAGARARRRARPARAGARARLPRRRPRATWASGEGLEDMRRALALALEQGQGRDAAVHPQQPRARRSGRTRGRRRRSPPAERGSTSASGAASPSSRSRSPA